MFVGWIPVFHLPKIISDISADLPLSHELAAVVPGTTVCTVVRTYYILSMIRTVIHRKMESEYRIFGG